MGIPIDTYKVEGKDIIIDWEAKLIIIESMSASPFIVEKYQWKKLKLVILRVKSLINIKSFKLDTF